MNKTYGWDKFLSYDNFKVAFDRLKTAPMHEHKNLYRNELIAFEMFLEENLSTTIQLLKDDGYTNLNQKAYKFYLPKPKGLVRPITHLSFIDLIVYQALGNIVAESFKDVLKPYQNKMIFGNIYNDDKNSKIFFFKPWKYNWKNFQKLSKQFIDDEEYNYIVEFDIASFYDTINHNVLKTILEKKIDKKVVDILIYILKYSSADFSRHQNIIANGIPQGPIASAILAEVFLNNFFDNFFSKQMGKDEIKYIRYADDIRIFTKEEYIGNKYITILDLLCRDIGLIPQSSKIEVKTCLDSKEFIDNSVNKFSQIQKYYKKNNTLQSKENNKAIKELISMINNKKIDKTKFGFFIYKVSKDDDLKDLLIKNISELFLFINAVLFYLHKHYIDDTEVVTELYEKIIKNKKVYLDYPKFIFLKFFSKKIQFDTEVYEKDFLETNQNKWWLYKKEILSWMLYHNEKDKILSIETNDKNELLEQYIIKAKYDITTDLTLKEEFENTLINSDYLGNQILGVYLKYQRVFFKYKNNIKINKTISMYSPFYNKVINNKDFNFLNTELKKSHKDLTNNEIFFNEKIFYKQNEAYQLYNLFKMMLSSKNNNNYKSFIDTLDQLSHIITERILLIQNSDITLGNYGSELKNNTFLSETFFTLSQSFNKIHKIRNNELHPKDLKTGEFHSKKDEYDTKQSIINEYYNEWIEVIVEILNWYINKIK
ncbi:MAG: RNA-directed DNA polymerase (Reverse transcriptase) [uncultured Campylobacterales bacterium]|uniref:RNA-directed DNA polymerase (Reverse transcriptase) n=1 Tax=uncultured Campylobacterales bacterium TaxID=352960 RepID=A0A6S6SXV5_9BACT|nr:MAG: RNA-directed DNA polymerase (Reverse transcriptase) [uncultured Campylobacterales bacterium]